MKKFFFVKVLALSLSLTSLLLAQELEETDKPSDWPTDLWNICWKGSYVDFTEGKWIRETTENQIRYAKNYQAWYAEKKQVGISKSFGGIEMMLIPPGRYLQGSPTNEADRESDENQRKVLISQGFWCGKYEITQAQWLSVMGTEPSYFKGSQRPVENVSWDESKEFCSQLGVQLLSEAQWEYACRGGTTSRFNWGEWWDRNKLNSASYSAKQGLMNMSQWNNFEFGDKWQGLGAGTMNVGSFKENANAWNLYDMHGNVWEWCEDYYHDSYGGDATDPVNLSSSADRVRRGGCWFSSAVRCRSANRSWNVPEGRDVRLGLRVFKSL